MESGTLGDKVNPWTLPMFRTIRTIEPRSASEQAAYSKWLDERTDREDARADRAHGAEGVIPLPLWIVLLLSATVIFVYMLFFADSAERAIVQATMMGGVAIVDTYACSAFEDTRAKAQEFGARGATVKAFEPAGAAAGWSRVVDPDGAHLAALRRLGHFRGRRIVELGCGDGRLTVGIAADAASVLAFDPDADAVGRAWESLSEEPALRVTYEVASGKAIEIEPAAFDLAVFSWSL